MLIDIKTYHHSDVFVYSLRKTKEMMPPIKIPTSKVKNKTMALLLSKDHNKKLTFVLS
jgi:hypothetical protein